MLTIADHLIREAERRGVRLLADAGQIRLDGPPEALDERFTTLVHANGEAILRRVDPVRARDRWLRPITPGPGAGLLFVIPAAGTGAGRYEGWRQAAPPGLEIVAVQPPGREDRLGEPAFTEAGPLADEIARRIAAWTSARPDRPCGIFGHSTGARVACVGLVVFGTGCDGEVGVGEQGQAGPAGGLSRPRAWLASWWSSSMKWPHASRAGPAHGPGQSPQPGDRPPSDHLILSRHSGLLPLV